MAYSLIRESIMSHDHSLSDLYTVAVTLCHGDLPINFLSDWYHPVQPDETAHCYISLAGRLTKKCIFIETEAHALKLVDALKPKLLKRIPSIAFTVRKVTSGELDYRRKKARIEAQENGKKIELLNSSS